MIEQCEKCALYNSLGCPYSGVGAEDFEDCDEYRPGEEAKITDPVKKRLFNLLKDSPSLDVFYEEQWTESVEYLVSNGVTIKSEIAREIFTEIKHRIKTDITIKLTERKRRIDTVGTSDKFVRAIDNKISALQSVLDFIEYLEKKYTEENI